MAARTGHDIGPSADDIVTPDLVDWEDGLSEEEAVAVGLWNNSAYQELLADLLITRADIIQASQLSNPQATTMIPVGPKQWEFALNVPLDVLWLRPLRVSAAQLESERVAERLTQDGLNVVRDIRVAYIDWRLAQSRADLAEQAARLRGEVARMAEARLAAGAVAELDVSAMRLDAVIAASEGVKAASDVELARERLRYVLGLQLAPVHLQLAPVAASSRMQFAPLSIERLVDEAVSTRPDLRAVRLAVGAAGDRAELARRDIFQLAGVLPDINSRGRKGFEAGPGLQFTVPIFHQNQGAIARAEADAERLRRQFVNRRDLVAWEVRQAYIQLLQARRELAMWRDQVLPQADQAVISSRKALEEDGVSLLLVLETTRQLLTAQQRELEAEAQLRRAVAELERSVGRRLFDVASLELSTMENLPLPPVETAGDAP